MNNYKELEQIAKIYGGLVVVCINPDSPAARAGVKDGDILLKWNGVQIPTVQAFIDARAVHVDEVVATYVRNGKEFEVTLDLSVDREPNKSYEKLN